MLDPCEVPSYHQWEIGPIAPYAHISRPSGNHLRGDKYPLDHHMHVCAIKGSALIYQKKLCPGDPWVNCKEYALIFGALVAHRARNISNYWRISNVVQSWPRECGKCHKTLTGIFFLPCYLFVQRWRQLYQGTHCLPKKGRKNKRKTKEKKHGIA